MGDICQTLLKGKRIRVLFYKVSCTVFCCHISLVLNILASDNDDLKEDNSLPPLNPKVCESHELISPAPIIRNTHSKKTLPSHSLVKSFETFVSLPVVDQESLLNEWGITLKDFQSNTGAKNLCGNISPPHG